MLPTHDQRQDECRRREPKSIKLGREEKERGGREKTKKMAEGDESKEVSAGHPPGDPGGPLTASPGNCQYSQLPPLSWGRVSGQLVPPGPIPPASTSSAPPSPLNDRTVYPGNRWKQWNATCGMMGVMAAIPQ